MNIEENSAKVFAGALASLVADKSLSPQKALATETQKVTGSDSAPPPAGKQDSRNA